MASARLVQVRWRRSGCSMSSVFVQPDRGLLEAVAIVADATMTALGGLAMDDTGAYGARVRTRPTPASTTRRRCPSPASPPVDAVASDGFVAAAATTDGAVWDTMAGSWQPSGISGAARSVVAAREGSPPSTTGAAHRRSGPAPAQVGATG